MKNKLLYGIGVLAAFFTAGCESLEDTYSEWTDGSMIRYVGSLDTVNLEAGWKRLRLTWVNSLDANIKWTKVTWQSDKETSPEVRFIERQKDKIQDTLWLEGLEDALYTVKLSNLSADSTESFVKEIYKRPYTTNHEDLRVFTRGIIKYYPLGDKLVVVVDEANEYLKELALHYTGTDNREHTWDILAHMTDSLRMEVYGISLRDYMFLLPGEEDGGVEGIDFSKPLTIVRKGRMAECLDEIPFADVVLEKGEQPWSPAFELWMVRLYGADWKNQVDTLTEIDLDYDLSTFEDLFYFPNLKKVNLGKNRFLYKAKKDHRSMTDQYKGLVTLQFLKDTRNVETVLYNDMYFFGDGPADYWDTYESFLQQTGKIKKGLLEKKKDTDQQQPTIEPLDATGWKVTCSDTLYSGNKPGGVDDLLDGDNETCFAPGSRSAIMTYEIKFDMQVSQRLKGFKLVQAHPDAIVDPGTRKKVDGYLVPIVKIEVSEDDIYWKDATYVEGYITVGDNAGEATYLSVRKDLEPVRYIRLSLSNRQIGTLDDAIATYGVRLGDFIPY